MRSDSRAIDRVPAVSVVIPAYNAESTIRDTIRSVLSQSAGPGWELIVVDDGSTDSTRRAALAETSSCDRAVVLTQENAGRGMALNRALAVARGQWLLPLDADDLLEPDAIKMQVEFADRHPGFELHSWGYFMLPEGGEKTRMVHPVTDRIHEVSLVDALRNDVPRMIGTMLINADTVRTIGGYRSIYAEDLDLVFRALTNGARWLHNPQPLHTYRIVASSKSRRYVPQTRGKLEAYDWVIHNSDSDESARRLARDQYRRMAKDLALYRFRTALDSGEWSAARKAAPKAFRYLAGKPHWWLLMMLVIIAPRVLQSILSRADHAMLAPSEPGL